MFENEQAEFEDRISSMVAERVKQKNARLISSQNHAQYSHGHAWTHIDASTGERNEGTFKEHSAEVAIPTSKIIDNDASTIVAFLEEMSNEMHGQVARSLYEMLDKSVSNTSSETQFRIDPTMSEEERDAAILASLDEALEKIWLGVDRYGAVIYPELHVHPSNELILGAVRRHALRKPDERREEEIHERSRVKEIETLQRETERLSKFRRK